MFDLPVSVTNSISESDDRIDCALLENELLTAAEIEESSDTLPGQPWVEGVSTTSSSDATQTGMGSRCHSGFRRFVGVAFAMTALLNLLA